MRACKVLLGISFLIGSSSALADTSNICRQALTQIKTIESRPRTQKNPLLQFGRNEDAPFDYRRFQLKHLRSGVINGLHLAQARLKLIKHSSEEPSFANTIEAIEYVAPELDQIDNVFENSLHMNLTPQLQGLHQQLNPRIINFRNGLFQDEELFARVKIVYNNSNIRAQLNAEQRQLLEKTYAKFVRKGALLSKSDKTRVKKIEVRLQDIAQEFKKRLNIAAENTFVEVTDPKRLGGLPEDLIKAAQKNAVERKKPESWIFPATPQYYLQVQKFADDAALREEMWRSYASLNSSGETDNSPLILEAIQIRKERATILGFASHMDYMTADRMAQSAQNVRQFIENLYTYYRAAADREFAQLKKFAQVDDLKPWDVTYYSRLLQEAEYQFSESEVRPYLQFENMMAAAHYVATTLFGIQFKKLSDVPTWHSSVLTYQVLDKDGTHLGYFYVDPMARKGKRAGAWMGNLQNQGVIHSELKQPHVYNIYNFLPPQENEPLLLYLDNKRTVFHEFGHFLHSLFSRVTYPSLGSLNIAWDIVEFPSKFFENFGNNREVLKKFALHYKTGEPIPDELLAKIERAQNFQAGMKCLNALRVYSLDILLHGSGVSWVKTKDDLKKLEAQLQKYMIIPYSEGLRSATMYHIFSSGYDGGLYSYDWAEAYAADAFDLFEDNGVLNPELGKLYRREFLAPGATLDPNEMYRRLRGRDLDSSALLRRDGVN